MKSNTKASKLKVYFLAARPMFLTASTAPVVVGTALAYATAGVFEPVLFFLALFAITAIHSGANIINDYYDHLSGNDWINRNYTPFSGGSRYIQNGIITPQATLKLGLAALAAGCAAGILIVFVTKSIFILILGIIGITGGFFWTAGPLRLCYRYIGEPFIFILFGLLPVYGAYYLQTRAIDFNPLVGGYLVGTLISLVLLINTFGDISADAAVNKRTLAVRFGVSVGIRVYRTALIAGYAAAFLSGIFIRQMRFAAVLFLLTLPVAIYILKTADEKNLTRPGNTLPNRLTIILHFAGTLALTAGFVIYGLLSR